VVLDGGRVVEDGRHEDLLARPGRYAAMWRAFDVNQTDDEEEEAASA
jgi:ATP-binding cassette subfamily B protein